MADIQITDDLGAAVPSVKIDLSQPSSLLQYAKSALFHLTVAPEFIERAPLTLTAAAPNPISFQLKLQHEFQLGNTKPEIDLNPSLQVILRANATEGSSLFDQSPFQAAVTVPPDTGYVSLSLEGGVGLGLSGSSGDLTFGVDAGGTITLEYWKAFPLGAGQSTLGAAAGLTITRFVIPAALDDLQKLGLHDVCTVAGQGSLKISGGFDVSLSPNPLASVALPLNAGTVAVKAGVMAGVSASFTVAGSYQIRARKTSAETIELSVYKQRGTTLTTSLSVSAGATVNFGTTDLLKALIGAISTNPNDDATQKLFEDGGLSKDEIAALTGAIQDGLNHSVQASLDLALSKLADDEAAFQYEIQPSAMDAAANSAVSRALKGDFSELTVLETKSAGGLLAPGVKLLSSVLTSVRKKQTTLRLNLIGLVNLISVSELIRKCVVVKDPGTGDLTIADSATGNTINAEVQPLRRTQALCKAAFESLMLTATYRVSNAVTMTGLASHSFHFAFNSTTKSPVMAEYLRWFVAMKLLSRADADACLKQFPGAGPSTCLLRTDMDDSACQSLFFRAPGQLWDVAHYQGLGRDAMRAVIDPANSDIDRFRYALLDQHWDEAVAIGPNNNLAPLVGVHLTDSSGRMIIPFLIGDVATIAWWATAMRQAGESVLDMQQFLASATAVDSPEFAKRRDQLQKKMAAMIGKSSARFDDPWGLISLFWAGGSSGASGRISAATLLLQR